jgi:hypothetical protein
LEQRRQKQLPDYRSQDGPAGGQDRGQTLEQIRKRAREEWIRMRRTVDRAEAQDRSLDDKDLSL